VLQFLVMQSDLKSAHWMRFKAGCSIRAGEVGGFAKAQRLTAAMAVGVSKAAASESELASLA
jgi:hypothetical protein